MENNRFKFNKFTLAGKISIGFISLIILLAIFAPYISQHPKNAPSGQALQAPNLAHPLGTDDLGIDLLAQIVFGARISLIIGLSTALLAGFIGAILGVIAGYYGGNIDRLIMRLTDMVIALPDLPMMILLGAFFGPSIKNIILVLALFSWTRPARIIRSKIISIKNEGYIRMAESYGAGFFHLFLNHFLPAILPILSISLIRIASRSIVAEAGLAFLGLGDPTSKSWGLILNHAINFQGIYFTDYWKWWVVFPLLSTMLLILAISSISKDLEKVFNEKL